METERTLGMLVEQGRHVAKELNELKTDVKMLLGFRWKIYAVTSCLGTLFGFMASIAVEMFRR